MLRVAGGGVCLSGGRVAGQSWTMKLSVALFFAGLFGALAAVFILLSFGTDYWLLASETCLTNPNGSVGPGVNVEVGVGPLTTQNKTKCHLYSGTELGFNIKGEF